MPVLLVGLLSTKANASRLVVRPSESPVCRGSDPWEGWSHVRDTSKRYLSELKQWAVRMHAEVRADYATSWAAMGKVVGL